MRKNMIHHIIRFLVTMFLIFVSVTILACGGGGGDNGEIVDNGDVVDDGDNGDDSSEDDNLDLVPLVPCMYYVSCIEPQDPSTTPGATVTILAQTNSDNLDGSQWTGNIIIFGSSAGGPIDMVSDDFPFDLEKQPNSISNDLISNIIPITIEGTRTPVDEVPFTVTQDVELIFYYYIGSNEMNIVVSVKEGEECLPGFNCWPFAALGDINTTVPVLECPNQNLTLN